MNSTGKGSCITFYSYKGGVGRTQALLNVGLLLAKFGDRVLLVDFDLEAPGLTYSMTTERQRRSSPGVVDLLRSERDKEEIFRFSELDEYCIPREFAQEGAGDSPTTLWVMTSGRLDADYGSRLADLNLSSFVPSETKATEQSRAAAIFFASFRDALRTKFDYILIDSRTGYSEEGGICTQLLADHIVMVSGLNHQNVEGTVRQLEAWRRRDRVRNIDSILVLAGPVPLGYEDRVEDSLQKLAMAAVAEDRKRSVVRIPYHPRLAISEWMAVLESPESELGLRYSDIASYIRRQVRGDPSERHLEAIRMLRSGRNVESVLRVAAEFAREEREYFQALIDDAFWLTRWPGSRDVARQFLASVAELEVIRESNELSNLLLRLALRAGLWSDAAALADVLSSDAEPWSLEWLELKATVSECKIKIGVPDLESSAEYLRMVALETRGLLNAADDTPSKMNSSDSASRLLALMRLTLACAKGFRIVGDVERAVTLLANSPVSDARIKPGESDVSSTIQPYGGRLGLDKHRLGPLGEMDAAMAMQVGDCRYDLGEYSHARLTYRQVLGLVDPINVSVHQRGRLRLGWAELACGNVDGARTQAASADRAAHNDGDELAVARCQVLMARISIDCGLTAECESLLQAGRATITAYERAPEMDQVMLVEVLAARARGDRDLLRFRRYAEEAASHHRYVSAGRLLLEIALSSPPQDDSGSINASANNQILRALSVLAGTGLRSETQLAAVVARCFESARDQSLALRVASTYQEMISVADHDVDYRSGQELLADGSVPDVNRIRALSYVGWLLSVSPRARFVIDVFREQGIEIAQEFDLVWDWFASRSLHSSTSGSGVYGLGADLNMLSGIALGLRQTSPRLTRPSRLVVSIHDRVGLSSPLFGVLERQI